MLRIVVFASETSKSIQVRLVACFLMIAWAGYTAGTNGRPSKDGLVRTAFPSILEYMGACTLSM
jgi:hypothetical protein